MSGLVRCPHCSRRLDATFTTDLHGHVQEHVEFCGCPESRRLAGICKYCDLPTDSSRSRYCGDEHRRRGQREAFARYRRSAKGKASQKRENRRRRTATGRAKRRLYERDNRSTPEWRARRSARRKALAKKKPELKREQHRRYKERYPERVREQMQRANAKRADAKREHMHRYATKYVGPGRSPTCRDCNGEIPFNGRGRPHARCETCDPKSWSRNQSAASPQERAA